MTIWVSFWNWVDFLVFDGWVISCMSDKSWIRASWATGTCVAEVNHEIKCSGLCYGRWLLLQRQNQLLQQSRIERQLLLPLQRWHLPLIVWEGLYSVSSLMFCWSGLLQFRPIFCNKNPDLFSTLIMSRRLGLWPLEALGSWSWVDFTKFSRDWVFFQVSI